MRFSRPVAVIACIVLAGCATQPENIAPTYVSPQKYQALPCPDIASERTKVITKADEVADLQRQKATNDAVALGVGLFLFFPALAGLAEGTDQESELAQLKGDYEALTEAGINKRCFSA